MQLHFVGGFLGSGKTTAICRAAKTLVTGGLKVGIITNDQGINLVDTGFLRLENLPAVEVSGGCFCCRYDQLEQRLDELIERVHPDVIFAESVGSCTDLVATVIEPLRQLSASVKSPASFSVFVDSRLLRHHLLDHSLPFSEDVIYIFEKQIEEAGWLIVNKVDLLSPEQRLELAELVREKFPQQEVIYQNSLVDDDIRNWLEKISTGEQVTGRTGLVMDYDRYAHGEASLAWVDETWRFEMAGRAEFTAILDGLRQELDRRGIAIGHLKYLIQAGRSGVKISRTTLDQSGWLDGLANIPTGPAELIINGRAEIPAQELSDLVSAVVNAYEIPAKRIESAAFHPGKPNPTHRLTE